MKNYLFKLLMLIVLVSCSNEPLGIATNSINSTEIKASLMEGRLHFESKEDFKTSIKYLKSLEDHEVETIMYSFYNDSFEPLYPFYKEDDEVPTLVRESIRVPNKFCKPHDRIRAVAANGKLLN